MLSQRAYRAHRGQATHPQGKPVDGLCEVRACDHRSPTFAYGLTRFACQTAIEEEIQQSAAKSLKASTNPLALERLG